MYKLWYPPHVHLNVAGSLLVSKTTSWCLVTISENIWRYSSSVQHSIWSGTTSYQVTLHSRDRVTSPLIVTEITQSKKCLKNVYLIGMLSKLKQQPLFFCSCVWSWTPFCCLLLLVNLFPCFRPCMIGLLLSLNLPLREFYLMSSPILQCLQ